MQCPLKIDCNYSFCRAILFYPSSLLFVCFMSILIISILSLALFVIKRIPSYYMQDSHVITYCAIEIFGASVAIAFITNFTQIVISGFAIDWFWTKDKNLVSRYFIRKHIDRTFRYLTFRKKKTLSCDLSLIKLNAFFQFSSGNSGFWINTIATERLRTFASLLERY